MTEKNHSAAAAGSHRGIEHAPRRTRRCLPSAGADQAEATHQGHRAGGFAGRLPLVALLLGQAPPAPHDAGRIPLGDHLPGGLLIVAIGLMIALPLMTGRSPHITVYPEQVEVGLTDVTGLNLQVDEVIRTLDVFLGYGTFRDELGGTPGGDPVRGAARNGQDLSREGDGEAGGGSVPVHLGVVDGVDVPGHDRLSHPVVLQGAPESRAQGRGAIGFIEEIDAIAGSRIA